MKHLVTLYDLTPADAVEIFQLAADLKRDLTAGKRPSPLAGYVLTQVFEKPSLRTRLSFEAAMMQLGGSSIFLSRKDAGLEGRESHADVARVIGGYSDVIVLRTFARSLIEEFAQHSGCAIINGLSDDDHPCQALTDLFTIQEAFGSLKGHKLAYIGDGNNVAASLAVCCAMFGVPYSLATPPGYELRPQVRAEIQRRYPAAKIEQHTDPKAAVKGADVIYTDVWASMGQENEKDQRAQIFAPYQVNAALMKAAQPGAKFMHCLPARRGQEVTDEVIDAPTSIAFPQAENRMHLAKGLLLWLLRK
ncbi:MAG: ornithine carbamoyltransferase [Planctomycetaceae bacterium]